MACPILQRTLTLPDLVAYFVLTLDDFLRWNELKIYRCANMALESGIWMPAIENIPLSVKVISLALLFFSFAKLYAVLIRERPWRGIPLVTIDGEDPKTSWVNHGGAVIRKGLKENIGLFQVITGNGPRIVLRNWAAQEIRKNDPAFDFAKTSSKDLFAGYHGFEGVNNALTNPTLIPDMVRTKLTQSLGLITDDLNDEALRSLHETYGEDGEWRTFKLSESLLNIVARLSARVFGGEKLCQNARWLEISKMYTVNIFLAARDLRKYTAIVRPLMQWFLPRCKTLRTQVYDARQLLAAEMEARKRETMNDIATGGKAAKKEDTIGWLTEITNGADIDLVGSQLGLSIAAIHTTSMSMAMAILDLCLHPEVVLPLRNEVISVLKKYGMCREALYKLEYMDSFLKESQRTRFPTGETFLVFAADRLGKFANCKISVLLNRAAMRQVTLADGTVVPKGSRVMVATAFQEPSIYPEPEKFDAERFVRKRQETGQNNSFQYVSISTEHLGFGYGKHACPGRFFVANEIKILMCHLLLKYDIQLEAGTKSEMLEVEASPMVDPATEIRLRRRQEELLI